MLAKEPEGGGGGHRHGRHFRKALEPIVHRRPPFPWATVMSMAVMANLPYWTSANMPPNGPKGLDGDRPGPGGLTIAPL
jgi:hypothetical protein